MREESLRVQVEGHLLHRLVLHPEDTRPVCAEAIFYHGQGDYAERYLDVLHPFTNRGVRCTITELPGHGRSPGKRGHCGDVDLLDSIIRDTLGAIVSRGNLPYGVMGHSMGGLLAARHLVLAGQGRLPIPRFAWLSSPLLEPGHDRAPFFLMCSRLLAPLLPSLTCSTGVVREACSSTSEEKQKEAGCATDEPSSSAPKHQLWHNRISLGWAITLLDFAELLSQKIGEIPEAIPLLYTQGGQDPVCPPELARDIFARLPNQTKRYEELDDMRHEPFRGAGSQHLFATLNDWLESLKLHKV